MVGGNRAWLRARFVVCGLSAYSDPATRALFLLGLGLGTATDAAFAAMSSKIFPEAIGAETIAPWL